MHPAHSTRAGPTPDIERLPPGLCVLVIAGLSALSWAVLISIVLIVLATL
jgi:hypothetical protein